MLLALSCQVQAVTYSADVIAKRTRNVQVNRELTIRNVYGQKQFTIQKNVVRDRRGKIINFNKINNL